MLMHRRAQKPAAAQRCRPRRSLVPACALALMALLNIAPADAKLPREIGRAFLDAGIPLNHVSIVVQDTTRPRPLFDHDGDRARSPASVMKIVTTFAALELLGPDYRWKTEAYVGGPLDGGVLHGDLIVKGYGDPKITIEQWQSFIARLRANGLAAIDGDLALDRSRFALPPHDAGAFDHEPLKPYNVGPDALLVNFKAVKLTFAPDPTGMRVDVRAEPPLDAVTLGTRPTAAADGCGDWLLRAASATGGSRCSTIRTTCTRCSGRTSARPADASTAASRRGPRHAQLRSPCSNPRRCTTSSATSTSCRTT
jgi:D-alanyl-D-alanine carboxypeptidase